MRHNEEETPARKDERFRLLAELTPFLVWTADPIHFRGRYCNPSWYAYTGLKPEENDGSIWKDLVHPDDLNDLIRTWFEAHSQGNIFETELRFRRHDGVFRWHLTRAQPHRDQQGNIVEWYGTLVDIHEQRLAAERARHYQDVATRLSRAVTLSEVYDIAIKEGFAAAGAQGGVLMWRTEDGDNLRVIHSSGFPHDLPPEMTLVPLSLEAPLPTAIRTGKPVFCESRATSLARFNGPNVDKTVQLSGCEAFASLPLWMQGEVVGGLGLGFTEARSFKEEERTLLLTLANLCSQALERAHLYENLHRAVKARDEFLSIASHELKNPLAALRLQLQTLLYNVSNASELSLDRVLQKLRIAEHESGRLCQIVNDLLDVSHIAAGKLILRPQAFALADAVLDVVARYREEAAKAQCTVKVDLQPGIVGIWDRTRVEQILSNLIQNAVKYAPGTTIELTARQNGKSVQLAVSDEGMGIPSDKLGKIFERFERAAYPQHVNGLGLGLYIVRQIVLAHGGEVKVTSEMGKGTRFLIDLPNALPAMGS